MSKKPNQITERGYTASSSGGAAPANIRCESVGRLTNQIVQLLMLGNISVRVVCFAPFFKLAGTVEEDAGLFPGVAATVPDSLFSVFPSSLHPELFLAAERGVLVFFIVLSSSGFVLVEAVVLFCRS